MDKQRQEEIIKLLTEKGSIQPCPRCLNPQFELVGESVIPLNQEITPHWAGTPTIPVILLACNKCGYLSYHAERILHQQSPLRF
jgi:hypothetical protein